MLKHVRITLRAHPKNLVLEWRGLVVAPESRQAGSKHALLKPGLRAVEHAWATSHRVRLPRRSPHPSGLFVGEESSVASQWFEQWTA